MNTNLFKTLFFVFVLSFNHYALASSDHEGDDHAHDSGEHDDDDHLHDSHEHAGEHEEEVTIKLDAAQIRTAGIIVKPLTEQAVKDIIVAPGEVMLNAYSTASITSRISAQVIERHARLGDHVNSGDPLLTLSSVAMAEAQGDLLVTEREWKRVKKLGEKVVSAQRYTEARVKHEQARARVLAYGMTEKQLDAYVKSGDASQADGTFQLLAPQEGTVIRDDFINGELIEPGRELFIISDESVLWVEAHLTPSQAVKIPVGASASVIAERNEFHGKVIQAHHALDENTRTLGVRLEVPNPEHSLHPGVFVQARIDSGGSEKALTLPVTAILRSPDGDWQVFVEHQAGEYEPHEVELLRTVGELAVVSGIEAGTRVVTQGAFFIQSELAKSGFDIHDH